MAQWSNGKTSDFQSEESGLESRRGDSFFFLIKIGEPFLVTCKVAQWKRAGLITQRSEDRNLVLLCFLVFSFQYGLLGKTWVAKGVLNSHRR